MAKTALLIIDMQNYFAPMIKTALPAILALADFFQNYKMPIILTQHGHPPTDFTPPIKNQLILKWGISGSLKPDTPDWELQDAIKSLLKSTSATTSSPPTTLVPKNTYDAFLHTPLEDILVQKDIDRVVVCGVMTNCCVDTTARSAFNRGLETWIVGEACGSCDKRSHDNALKGWSYGYGDVVGVGECVGRLKGEGEGE